MPEIHWLGAEQCHDAGLVGGKAAALSRLAALHRIPPGFALSAVPGYSLAMPPSVRDAVCEAYIELAARTAVADTAVAVRSSALDEDGADASFAGQHDTYLNIRGHNQLLDAIERCIGSASSPVALDYRARRGLPVDDVRIGVLVQELVPSDVSAVVFSANPVTGRRDEIMINASWGLGESIVGGSVTPDTFVVDKAGMQVAWRDLACKERMTVLSDVGTTEVPVPAEMQMRSSLDDAQVLEMAQLAWQLETVLGYPVDVECAIARGTLYLLQCRPVTTLR
ncbi:MAG: PEP/pyruvate-binding domain-containing protein [Dehalococcoidia bacterium]|nr:PEP/pyruvate-binding domain-containing protein [Dehalococcoidia bacterium]